MQRIDSKELSEWQAYWEIEPFGPVVDNLNFATIASILYNVNKKKGAPTKTTEEMAFGSFEKEQSEGDLKRMILDMVDTHNKKEEKKNNG